MTDLNDWNRKVIEEFRANGGTVGGQFEGASLLLIHTTGRHTGKERVNPLAYQALAGDVAVFGSKGGAPTHPDWCLNLVDDPDVRVELGTVTFDATARVTEGEEREKIWTRQKQAVPGFAECEAKTTRTIPVVVLSRKG